MTRLALAAPARVIGINNNNNNDAFLFTLSAAAFSKHNLF